MGSGCSSNNNQPLTRKAPAVPGLKLVIVGDCEVGKTSVYLRYLHNQFCPIYTHTDKVNIDNVVQKINQPSHALTSLTLWDIPGREDVNLHPAYFRDMDGLIVVADLTEESSIRLSPVWKQLALNSAAASTGAQQEEALPASHQHVPVLLMGNKLDLVEEQMFADLAAEKEVVGEEGEVNSTLLSERKLPKLRKPASVQLLEQVSHSNFFTGSAVVSAKSGDGSVNQAVRSFVRHIMETRVHMTRRWNTKVVQEKDKRSKDRATITLNDVGIPEFDELFGQGQVLLTRVSSLAALFKDTLTRFQDKCRTAGVTGEDDGAASLENCLVGLREALALHSIGLKLQLKDDFCLLEAKSVEDKEIEKPVRYALKTFNKEFAAVCQTAVKELPTIITSLDVLDAHLAKLCSHYEVPPPPPPQGSQTVHHNNDDDDNMNNNNSKSGVDVKAASEGIEKNRGKLVHCRHHARDLITKVETVLKKARTAFVW